MVSSMKNKEWKWAFEQKKLNKTGVKRMINFPSASLTIRTYH